MGTKRLNVTVDEELHRKIKAYVAMTGRTISEYIIELVKKDLSKQEKTDE